ncbi:MAG: DNA recombination protein RmuC, partial [Chloroflexi bacterium]|nr:DNA recombination protein RmuC [Chloroflexota bacterium]
MVALAAAFFWRTRHSAEIAGALHDVSARQMLLEEKLGSLQPLTQHVTTIRAGLAQLQAYLQARQDLENETHQALHRLERVLAGTQARGAAGEELLDLIFSQLPPSWQVRNYRVENKVVEFGLMLPNGLILPIDHKWAAVPLLEQFLAAKADDHALRKRLK